MKRHPTLIPFSHDHRRFLFLAQLLKEHAPPYPGYPSDPIGKAQYAQKQYQPFLYNHIQKEEHILLPFLANRNSELDMLIQRIKEEHVQLLQAFQMLPTLHPQPHVLDQLGKLLEQHIRLEERQLFQQTQAILSAVEMNELATQLQRHP